MKIFKTARIKKFSSIIMLLALLINIFAPLANASVDINSAYLSAESEWVTGHIYYNKNGTLISLRCAYVTYTINGVSYPAYCVNQDLDGVDPTHSETVDIDGLYSNNKVWRVLKNGYPYTSYSAMGLKNKYEAFFVTKYAIYTMLGQVDADNFVAMDGYEYVYNALMNLIDIGLNGTETYKSPSVSLTTSGSATTTTIDGVEYYVQSYKATSDLEFTTFDVNLTRFPDGTLILNSNNKEQTSFSGTTTFKIAIPVDEITSDVNGLIRLSNVQVKTYPVLYGKTRLSGYQNYAMAYDPYETTDTQTTLSITVPDITVVKEDRDTGEVLAGAEYDIIDVETEEVVLHVGPTDENGEITFTGLTAGTYKLVETVAPEGYNLDEEEHEFTVEVDGSDISISCKDKIITSTITAVKESLDDSDITGFTAGTLLANATFEIYDSDGELVATITTDENGEADIELPYGTYTIKEVASPEFYLLDEETNVAEFTVENEGEEIELVFQNESVKLGLEITKSGIVQTQPNDEIRYNFTITNNSNIDVDNFTWTDNLPYEYVTLTKLFTGTYNYDHDYTIWYKTTDSDEWVQYVNPNTEDGTYNTLKNNYVDFTTVDGEVTDFKVEFGTVESDFASTEDESPFIFCKVKDTVEGDDSWINYTSLTGDYTSDYGTIVELEDLAEWETTAYSYSLSVTKLPKTGF